MAGSLNGIRNRTVQRAESLKEVVHSILSCFAVLERKVFFTGHSLGGSVATILHFSHTLRLPRLRQYTENVKPITVVFGAFDPFIAGAGINHSDLSLQDDFSRYLALTNEGDFVPKKSVNIQYYSTANSKSDVQPNPRVPATVPHELREDGSVSFDDLIADFNEVLQCEISEVNPDSPIKDSAGHASGRPQKSQKPNDNVRNEEIKANLPLYVIDVPSSSIVPLEAGRLRTWMKTRGSGWKQHLCSTYLDNLSHCLFVESRESSPPVYAKIFEPTVNSALAQSEIVSGILVSLKICGVYLCGPLKLTIQVFEGDKEMFSRQSSTPNVLADGGLVRDEFRAGNLNIDRNERRDDLTVFASIKSFFGDIERFCVATEERVTSADKYFVENASPDQLVRVALLLRLASCSDPNMRIKLDDLVAPLLKVSDKQFLIALNEMIPEVQDDLLRDAVFRQVATEALQTVETVHFRLIPLINRLSTIRPDSPKQHQKRLIITFSIEQPANSSFVNDKKLVTLQKEYYTDPAIFFWIFSTRGGAVGTVREAMQLLAVNAAAVDAPIASGNAALELEHSISKIKAAAIASQAPYILPRVVEADFWKSLAEITLKGMDSLAGKLLLHSGILASQEFLKSWIGRGISMSALGSAIDYLAGAAPRHMNTIVPENDLPYWDRVVDTRAKTYMGLLDRLSIIFAENPSSSTLPEIPASLRATDAEEHIAKWKDFQWNFTQSSSNAGKVSKYSHDHIIDIIGKISCAHDLRAFLREIQSVAIIGSSRAGKSSLVKCLFVDQPVLFGDSPDKSTMNLQRYCSPEFHPYGVLDLPGNQEISKNVKNLIYMCDGAVGILIMVIDCDHALKDSLKHTVEALVALTRNGRLQLPWKILLTKADRKVQALLAEMGKTNSSEISNSLALSTFLEEVDNTDLEKPNQETVRNVEKALHLFKLQVADAVIQSAATMQLTKDDVLRNVHFACFDFEFKFKGYKGIPLALRAPSNPSELECVVWGYKQVAYWLKQEISGSAEANAV